MAKMKRCITYVTRRVPLLRGGLGFQRVRFLLTFRTVFFTKKIFALPIIIFRIFGRERLKKISRNKMKI